jgi:hypothetical protein
VFGREFLRVEVTEVFGDGAQENTGAKDEELEEAKDCEEGVREVSVY